MPDELKPWRRCGSTAELHSIAGIINGWVVECSNEDCEFGHPFTGLHRKSMKKAVAVWNRRAGEAKQND